MKIYNFWTLFSYYFLSFSDPELVDCEGMSAVHWSVKSRDLKTLQVLINYI